MCLIIDDIHVLARAPKTQEVLFNIFNHLHQTGKQIVMTTDVPPKDMAGIEGSALLSQVSLGLVYRYCTPRCERAADYYAPYDEERRAGDA